MLIRPWAEPEVELLILDMRSANPSETSVEDLDYTCSFHLPALRIGRHIYVADIRTDPAYSWSPDDRLAIPFHAAACQSLIVVTLNNQLTFVISVEKLLPYFYNIANVGQKHQILWDTWGPRATRAFSLFEGQSPVWFRNVYRTRFVYLSSHTEPERFYLSPTSIKRHCEGP
ncbi:unnamed protein product [Somion occarium]|uniref:Uncharacterized protein n=1 Tax=Somion occarium TaxID=3059160 RepID=A0ABP1D4F1_9APHY